MKTNRLIRKSTALFMALAVFAMIFTGCKKDDSSSNSGGNGGGGGGGGTGNYGTIVVGDQTYVVHSGLYEIIYDEDLQAYEVGIALLDSTSDDDANAYVLVIPFYEAIPTGTFTYYLEDDPQQGQCAGMFERNGSANTLYCTQGSVTISKVGANYKIVSQGTVMAMDASTMSLSVNFQGPLTEYSE